MDDLNDAIDQLKHSITKDGYACTLVKDVAKEYDLNPALLARKFLESTGVEPSQWRPPVYMLKLNRELAKKTASNLPRIVRQLPLDYVPKLLNEDSDSFRPKEQSDVNDETVDLFPITDIARGTLFSWEGDKFWDSGEYVFQGMSSSGNVFSAVNVRKNKTEWREVEDSAAFIECLRRNTIAGPEEY